jgi:hypothetical protein
MHNHLTARQWFTFCYYLCTIQSKVPSTCMSYITAIPLRTLKVASHKSVYPPMSYLSCNLRSHPTFIIALTLATISLNEGSFLKVSTCGLMSTNSNYSLIDPPKCKRITRSISIFITNVSIKHSITIHSFNKTSELRLWHRIHNYNIHYSRRNSYVHNELQKHKATT